MVPIRVQSASRHGDGRTWVPETSRKGTKQSTSRFHTRVRKADQKPSQETNNPGPRSKEPFRATLFQCAVAAAACGLGQLHRLASARTSSMEAPGMEVMPGSVEINRTCSAATIKSGKDVYFRLDSTLDWGDQERSSQRTRALIRSRASRVPRANRRQAAASGSGSSSAAVSGGGLSSGAASGWTRPCGRFSQP